jgi:choline dehydrogenase-like flavoprotein
VEGVQLNGYDYIVVGSGAGGGPLAARLGLAGNKVLVIEAGGDIAPTDWNISVPYFNSKASEDPQISWDFYVRSDNLLLVLPLIRIGQPLSNRSRECEGSKIPLPVSEWHLGPRTGPTC